jgi:hypothetical protein
MSMRVTVQYKPELRVCPFCAEPLEGVRWQDHFLLQYAEVRMENADVLFASLVCMKLADEIERDEEGQVFSAEVARLNMWIPLQAVYRESDRPLPTFRPDPGGNKERTH